MARFMAVWQPKSASGGISDAQTATLTASTSSPFTVGKRQMVMITATGSVYARFSIGTSAAAATDILLPFSGSVGSYVFETGDEFDTVNLIAAPITGTPTVCVVRLTP